MLRYCLKSAKTRDFPNFFNRFRGGRYNVFFNKTLFKNDLYLQNTLLIDHSILLKVFKLFKINLHNDLIGIPLYFLINLIGIYFFYKLMIEIFEKNKNNLILILILTITLFYNNLTNLDYSYF